MKVIGKILKGIGIAVVVLVLLGIVFGGGNSKKASSDSGSDKGQVAVSENSTEDEKQQETAKEEASATETSKEKYTITDEAFDTSNPYMASITGKLTNNTDHLQIEYTLYDNEGNQIGTALANVNNLKAGATWKFEAATFKAPDEIGSYELADVTGF